MAARGFAVTTDIAVIGAGPAGARAAYVLARHGARVTIFDASHPREKPCGGGVTGRALQIVADTLDAQQFNAITIHSARFTGRSGARPRAVDPPDATVSLDDGCLVVAGRREFDTALLAAAMKAGAALVHERALDVAVDRLGVTINTASQACRADAVVGADGANSLVRRRLARSFPRDQLSIATGYFADGVTSDEIVLEFVDNPPGYIWSFPRRDHLSVGICAPADVGVSAAGLRSIVASWLERTAIARAARLRPYSWPIPSLDRDAFDTLTVAGPRWCLVGDAAGLVDPITREGIFFALASGQWAAECLAADDSARRYDARVRDEAIAELTMAARVQERFFRPRFTGLVVRAIDESAAIRRIVADLIAGRQRYKTLTWRLLSTLDIPLALRAMFGE